jgi:hemerythrin HHE cation binding domain-containing protein
LSVEPIVTDLRDEPPTRVRTAAFYHARELRAGGVLVLLFADSPHLAMESVDLQLGHRLAWHAVQEAGGWWRVEVRPRDDVPPTDVLDLLTRDHRRLDDLLGKALRRVNAHDAAGTRPLLEQFAAGLRRHVRAENDLLAPLLPRPFGPDGTDHVEIMLREHEDIGRQLAEVEACFAGNGAPEAWELEPFLAILSGTLAKHEHREEANVFPRWEGAVAALLEARRAELLARVTALLAGSALAEDQRGRGPADE